MRESQCDFHAFAGIHSLSGYCQTNPARDDSSTGPHEVLLKGSGFAFGMHWITPKVCDAPAWGKRTSLTLPYKDIPSLHFAALTACSIYSSLPKESIKHSFLWQMISPFHFDFASQTEFFCLHRKTNEEIAQSLTLPCFPTSNLVVKRCMMSCRGKNLWSPS